MASNFVFLLGFLVNARKLKVVSGSETLIGVHGKIIECVNGDYKVALQGEIWNATSDEKFSLDEIVVVSNITGLILSIRGVK